MTGDQRHAPAALTPGKTKYPLYRRLGGPRGQSGRLRSILPTLAIDPRTFQPVASRYTDWTMASKHTNTYSRKHTHTTHTNKTIREISFFALIHPTCRLTHSMCTGLRKQFYTQQEMNVNSRFQTFAVFFMLYVFFWVIPRRLDFICRRFGTLFHLHRQVGV